MRLGAYTRDLLRSETSRGGALLEYVVVLPFHAPARREPEVELEILRFVAVGRPSERLSVGSAILFLRHQPWNATSAESTRRS
jgi:hypothetical protein